MNEKLKAMVTFWSGAYAPEGVLLIGGLNEQEGTDHTVVVLLRERGRQVWTTEWKARALLPGTDEAPEPLVIGLDGEVSRVGSNQLTDEPGIDTKGRPDKFGSLLGGRTVGTAQFVVGYRNQVYRRGGPGQWQAIDEELPGKSDTGARVFGLESIDGFNPDDLYTVGLHGAMWHRSDGNWKRIASPTNLRLTAVHCAADGWVYVCGQHGVTLKGKDDEWEHIDTNTEDTNFWDVSSIDGHVFFASDHVLYGLTANGLEPVPFPEYDLGLAGIPTSFFRLAKNHDSLLSVGPKDVLEFSGGKWQRIV
jgi:hypothetical protein